MSADIPTQLVTGLQVLAAQEPEGPEFGKASPLGLLIIIVLLVATALLIRSMNRQLRKLPKTFDTDHPEPDQAFDEGTDSVDPTDVGGPPHTDDVQADERKSAGT
ncbi:hypothetical protein [Gordonia rhizosphera]|uniref:Uncharacterized protein n=1 Tax=Gordonia rhizosphera NBRC 16068 TaxID=1108045 RepID=K6W3Y9_9ACTN|nr:hypothetical protein [Gordonia rhizosphera]GAB93865.1 hypothetical protein GORHZ_247_00030 [Gordonia rhizosphera NBRC 16068]